MASKPSANQGLGELSMLFNLLSDQTRIKIVMLLSNGEHTVTAICEEIGVAQPTVSHHLGLLRMNRLIVNRRQGKKVVYSLDDSVKRLKRSLKFSIPPFTVTVEN